MSAQTRAEDSEAFAEQYTSDLYDESPGVKLVLLVIHHEQPIRTGDIVRETRLSSGSVQRSLRELLDRNIIRKKRSIRDPRSTIYQTV